MAIVQPLRGMKDILFEEAEKFSQTIKTAEEISNNFGFVKSYFPIVESSEIFKRALGDVSDIVSKEMYSFTDKGENNITLRPEFTAGIVRALISNGLYQKLPFKIFTYGPVFRYERPQKGRQRQFYQINFESFGNALPVADAEIIALASQIIAKLGLQKKVKLELNSLGCQESRKKYRSSLVEYLEKYKNNLSEDSKIRLVSNPLRILDSKDRNDQKILTDAPSLKNSFTKEAKEFFAQLQNYLENLGIDFTLNDKLVRGLDYYSHTVFEFTTDLLGAQNAVFAGGRYDALIEQLGGKPVPAVGFAGGVERIIELAEFSAEKESPVILAAVSDKEFNYSFALLNKLRAKGVRAEILPASGNLMKKFKKAEKLNAKFLVIIGEDEIKNEQLTIRDLHTSQEKIYTMEEVVNYYQRIFS